MSLRLKMILGIGAILFMVILVYAIIAVRSQEAYLRDLARHEAELIAGVADRGLHRAMERGETDVVQAILRRMGEHPVLRAIRIVGPRGTIRRSSNPTELGRVLPPGERPPAGQRPEPIWDFRERTVAVFRTIPNGPHCVSCHQPDKDILGFLNVLVSFPPIDSEMAQHTTSMILVTILGLLTAGGLIAVTFTVMVGRRIDLLSRTMSQVEAGDLTARMPRGARDELGRLGESFNAMVARLADARRQVEDRHLGAIRRAEHMASLGKMAAGIAHEINNPLAGMQNCVRSLMKGTRNEDQRIQYLGMLLEGLGRIERTVGQLLDFAREAKPQFTRTNLRPILRRCLALLEHQLATRQITCGLSADGNQPDILVDSHQIEQVFLNILMNAVDAMPQGGKILVSASLQQREAGSFVEVQITDTGVGIPPEDLPRIFDPFFTTKDVGKGTGLGLSVSYGIVRAHGGFIEARSEVGKGSTFTVGLPVGEEASADH
jgi:signal transduction histidine kinase